ncbi:MATE family efflux transporter [Naasia sp. SYSU D00057]|uniref:MATE family efflux transporter n=1 Tax=Naasia sp. SYSU D00057 TaxID=2817380 RepID=UPI0027DD63A9|nr:MATE family efflux transporter [Naasia sp. SYSU D00057]
MPGLLRGLRPSPLDRDIARLAVPALGALVAEPLFLLTDTALVGHLGAESLAGVGVASTVLQTVVGLLVFLAYATTPLVARRLGEGDRAGAVAAGIDGMWLALAIGVVLALAAVPLAGPAVAAFGVGGAVAELGTAYLLVSLAGLPAMLVVIAGTGLLRGLQDTRTTLVVAGAGFAVNAVLNAILIYPAGLGVAGSALGTVIAQYAMAAVYAVLAVRSARATGARLSPSPVALGQVARSGGWLLLRTVTLRASLVLTTVAAAGLGLAALATAQVALTVFFALALALDALAIAAQAMLGHARGRGDSARIRAIAGRVALLGVLSGVVLALPTAALAGVAGYAFTTDPAVLEALPIALLILAAALPLAGYVFVLDGVLIGMGDNRYLAVAGLANLAGYGLVLAPVLLLRPEGAAATAALWAAFAVGMLGPRALTLGLRVRGTRWLGDVPHR